MTIRLLHGACELVLPKLEADSVDACVSDPPYGLNFMGKKWDAQVPSVEQWREVFRVLKPGAHLIAFGGTRTYHRMVCAIEDAGFEIRDQLAWIFGSGFPKSLDVSKAIDKARTEDVEPVRVICRAVRAAMDAKGLKSKDLAAHFGDCHPRLIDHWAARDTDSQPNLPTWEQWLTLRSVLAIADSHDAEVWRLNGRKGSPGDTWHNAEVVGEHAGELPGFVDHRFSSRDRTIRAASEAAIAWEGWGTALKPAHEPIVLARKPIEGTVAGNVQTHGTGALNIDGSRIDGESTLRVKRGGSNQFPHEDDAWVPKTVTVGSDVGRWPANVMHDGSDEVLAAFPNAPGQLADASASASASARKSQNVYGAMARGNGREGEPSADSANGGAVGFKMRPGARRDDEGSAARFFYCAKASREDREDGLAHMEKRPLLWPSGTQAPGTFQAEGTDRSARNNHPTVKPTELMRYLCRLITPPGGTVLDPFMGSGSTGRGAFLEGFSFIGIERDAQWIPIAEARIRAISPLFAEVSVA